MYMYIGRQPIYNSEYAIEGYELLYRTGQENSVMIKDPDAATRSVLTLAVSGFGLSQLTNGLPAFINFTRNLLLDNFVYLMDPSEVVVEIPGNINLDEKMSSKLQEIHRAGYRLSLNSYSETNGMLKFNKISDIFDIIRMDVSKNSRLQLKDLIRKLRGRYVRLLAEKVETEEQFETVTSLNFSLFQGYFFEKPICLRKETIFSETSYCKLLNVLMDPNLDYELCIRIIQEDPVLTHLFLIKVVSGAAPVREVAEEQIRRGLVRLGLHELQHWAGLVMLKQNSITASDAPPIRAYTRGIFIERLMEKSDRNVEPILGFFMGVVSLLDNVTGIPMQEVLNSLALPPEVRSALEGTGGGIYSDFMQYAIVYERGGANYGYKLPDIGLRIPDSSVSMLHMSAIKEADSAWVGMSEKPITAYQGTILKR